MEGVGEGPFKQGLQSDKTGIQRETYSRIIERDGMMFEERWTRQWFGDENYVDHFSSMPISRTCW